MPGLYFEDVEVGKTYVTPGRTITEADVVLFAGLSGDYNPLHTDEEFARQTPFGRRIAHGALGVAVVTGLLNRLGLFDGTATALLEIHTRFVKPVFIGDTVHVEVVISDKRETRRPDQGIVVRQHRLINQRGEAVQEGTSTLMVRRRPG